MVLFLLSGFIFLLLILLVLYFIATYNRFQSLKNGAEATLNQIKVALKKRIDLISQLVENVKSYANFERETLEKITELRTSVLKINTPEDVRNFEKQSREILGSVLFTVENYPNLRTAELAKDINESLQNVEDEIARLRYTYNNIVQEYNTMIDTFPSNLVAKNFGFRKLDYLEFEGEIKKRSGLEW